MKTILHLTCDYPDPIVSAKTRGVMNYVENTPGFRHVVYSLNRANWRRNIVSMPFGPDRVAVAYGAPPKALFLETRLRALSRWIVADLDAAGIAPDLIHAHKLSVEGLLAHDIHRDRAIPYICSIWGDTDLKFLGTRKDLRKRWEAVMAGADRLLPVAPWTAERFIRDYGLDPGKVEVVLPIVKHETSAPTTLTDAPRFVTLFNLNAYKRKNLHGLVTAVAALHKRDPRVTLDIFGAGNAETLCDIDAMIGNSGTRPFIRVKGQLPEPSFAATLNGYTAFVMPTLRETFGMVFVEALFCGLPILYTKNWSIDGLFPAGAIGYAWDGKTSGDLVTGLAHLIQNEQAIKQTIDRMARDGEFDRLRKSAIIAKYTDVLRSALDSDTRRTESGGEIRRGGKTAHP